MTVQSQTAKAGPYAGAGTTGPFPVSFRFLESSHLRVIKTAPDGGAQDLVITADYTVSGAGNQSGGAVTLTAALPVGYTLVVLRNVPITQLADYVEGDAFPAESHERALDKLTMLVQQQGESQSRALRVPESDIEVDTTLPPVAQRARRYLSFDDQGRPVSTTFDVDAVAKASADAIEAAGRAAESESNAAESEANAAASAQEASDFAGAVQGMVEGAMPSVHRFVGDGEQKEFDLGVELMAAQNVLVFLSGANQEPIEDYTVDGTVLKFEEAPADGVKGVAFVSPHTALAIGDAKNIIVETEDGLTTVAEYLQALANRTAYLKSLSVHVRDFGAVGDGDDSDKIQSAIQRAYEIGATELNFDPNIQHEISKAGFFNSYGVPERGLIVNGLNVKLTAPTSGGAVINVGRGADVGQGPNIERTGRITFVNPQVDGGSIAGENGFGIARGASVLVLNPTVRNCKRDYSGTREGGRAFTTHGRCRGVYVMNPTIINCSDAIHHSPAPDHSASAVKITQITGITKGAQTVITVADNGFAVGDYVYTYSVGGMTQLNPAYGFTPAFEVVAVSGNSITVDLDSSTFAGYTSGGNILLADLTDEGRSPGVFYSGVYAEDCEYTLVNVETANYPRNQNVLPTLFIDGITAKNCGTTETRGLISGSQASVQIDGLAVYNDASHPVQSLIRGSFQASKIDGVFDIHTLQYVIDADPTNENPAGTGIDVGIGGHPFGTSSDNQYKINLLYRGSQADISSLIHTTDLAGSSVDRFYRNDVSITVSGQRDGVAFARPLSNIALHNSNRFYIADASNRREYEGGIASASANLPSTSATKKIANAMLLTDVVRVQESSSQTASLIAVGASGDNRAQLRFSGGNNRWYVGIGGVDYWQFTSSNFVPNADNAYSVGSAGLRPSVVFAGTGTINTSDEREKNEWRDQSEAERLAALEIKQAIRSFKFVGRSRIHFGVGAQTVGEILRRHGLDPADYAFWCYDEWGEQPELKDDDGNITQEYRPAGNRYGIRYEELCMFILSAM